MTTLRDPFDVVHKKDIKNKQGDVVAQVDYVGWSQVADRLDDVSPGWSFSVVQLGEDWCLGRLNLGDGRGFENIGYAENADTSWKKEVLKDAVSDAFKRCAALAGVARYLYDKDAPHTSPGRAVPPPARPAPAPRPAAPSPAPAGGTPEEPEFLREVIGHDAPTAPRTAREAEQVSEGAFCPDHGLAWTLRPGGISKTTGKPYDGFWTCPSDARPWCKQKPSAKWVAMHEMAS